MRPPADVADIARAEPVVPGVPAPACRNCGAPAPGHFCPNCGQETRIALPTFAAFMREAAGRYVALDGRMWRTLYALVARPGHLTLEYFNGRRRRYIRPARLFLVLYLLLFAIVGFIQSPADLSDEVVFVNSDENGSAAGAPVAGNVDAKPKGAAAAAGKPAPVGADADAVGRGRAGHVDGRGEDTFIGLDRDLNLTLRLSGADLPVPEAVRKRYDHFKRLPKEEKAERLYAGALRYGPYAMVALLPAFALLQKLAYLGRGNRYPGRPRRYAEHLVYSAHLHAFAALAIIAMLLLPTGLPRVALAAWVVYYLIRARQVVYRGPWWAGVLRSLAIALVYLILVSFAIVGLLAVAVMVR